MTLKHPNHPNLFVRNSLICNPVVTRPREISLVFFGQRQRLRSSVAVSRGGKSMLRKTLIALMAIAALGMGSTAMAMHGGGGGFGGGGGWHGGGWHHGGGCQASAFHSHPFARHAFFVHNRHFFPHRHFAFFRRRHFFGVGLYATASCWTWVPTRFGWHRVWVCGWQYY